MKIGTVLKAIQYTVLQQAGVAVTPEQVGLKIKNPSALSGAFGKILGQSQAGAAGGLSLPTPPTPPDPASGDISEAQSKYNQELVAYNQSMQAYHLQMMRMLSAQFNQMQAISRSNANQQSSAAFASGTLGIGGIINTSSDSLE
jgi:hypothetical protein